MHHEAKQVQHKEASDSEESVKAKGVYKAPKTNAVAFREDEKKNKNLVKKSEYDRHKVAKTEFLEQLRKEALDLPQEVFMGAGRKTKTSRFEDKLEELEQSQFKRVSMSKKEKQKLRN